MQTNLVNWSLGDLCNPPTQMPWNKSTSWSFLQPKPTNVTSPNISLHNIHQTSSILTSTEASSRKSGSWTVTRWQPCEPWKVQPPRWRFWRKKRSKCLSWLTRQSRGQPPGKGMKVICVFFCRACKFYFPWCFLLGCENSWLRLRGWF